MLEVKITNRFMYNLIEQIESCTFCGEMVLGSGSDRVAVVFSDDMIVKIPQWHIIDPEEYTKEQLQEEIEQTKQWHKNATFHNFNGKILVFYSEGQTRDELNVYNIVPKEVIRKFGAEVYMWGKWHNHLITFSERLVPVEEDEVDNISVIDAARTLLEQIEIEMKDYPIRIRDIHGCNFGYAGQDNLKFVDLGWWTHAKNALGVFVDWDSFESWASEGSYYCDGDCSNCENSSCRG